MSLPRIPTSTYRLQFNRNFSFAQAREVVPYLHELGISDCYASPYFQARAESLHGYDIADHKRYRNGSTLDPRSALLSSIAQRTEASGLVNHFIQLPDERCLFVHQPLRVADDVDEENMRYLQLSIPVTHQR